MTAPLATRVEPRWSEPRVERSPRVRARRRACVTLVVALAASSWAVAHATGDPEQEDTPAPVSGTAPTGVATAEGLTPALARSVRLAVEAAAADGVDLQITSGWRSAERQAQLHAEAIEKHGSAEQARQWVLPPEESEHVAGRAVDVGPEAGIAWLRVHGVRFGLCQRYANEPWHFERLAGAKGSSCPPMEPHP